MSLLGYQFKLLRDPGALWIDAPPRRSCLGQMKKRTWEGPANMIQYIYMPSKADEMASLV